MTKISSAPHDKIGIRLAEILIALNRGEIVTPHMLAERHQVGIRSIYRDLNVRLATVVERVPGTEGKYQLAPQYQGKLKTEDIKTIARLMGTSGLFPNNSPRFWATFMDALTHSSFLVRGHEYENIAPKIPAFERLEQAIREGKVCHCYYKDKPRVLSPYRLINTRGIWYLAATEKGTLKAFSFSRISGLEVSNTTFTADPAIQNRIKDQDDIWFTEVKTEVILSIAPEIAYYFERRKLLPEQETIRNLENGGLLLRSQINHTEQILPQIRFWIPNVRIVEPEWLNKRLLDDLQGYLQGKK